MALITDQSTFFNSIQFITWKSQYSGSQGTQEFDEFFVTENQYVPTVQTVEGQARTKLTHGFNTYYKLQGFNSSTNSYEVWFSMGTPLLIPPSGHTLSNIEIILTWIDR